MVAPTDFCKRDCTTWGVAAILFIVNPMSMTCFTPAVAMLAVSGLVYIFAFGLVVVSGRCVFSSVDYLFKWVLPAILTNPHTALVYYSISTFRHIGTVVWPLLGILQFPLPTWRYLTIICWHVWCSWLPWQIILPGLNPLATMAICNTAAHYLYNPCNMLQCCHCFIAAGVLFGLYRKSHMSLDCICGDLN